VISFTPQPLYPQGKSPWYPLYRRLDGPQSRSGGCGEEKTFQTPPGLEPPIIQPAAQRYTTELSRLLIKKEGKKDKNNGRKSMRERKYSEKQIKRTEIRKGESERNSRTDVERCKKNRGTNKKGGKEMFLVKPTRCDAKGNDG
jgi:hypothetical protein